MTYKQIEAAREARLWIGQIIVPTVAMVLAIPETRQAVVERLNKKNKIVKHKFKKKEEV